LVSGIFGHVHIIVGVLTGTKENVGTSLETTWNSGRTLIHASSEVDDDLAVTAKNAFEAAIEGAKAIGVDTSEAASAAVTSALKAAGGYQRQRRETRA